jgi:xylulokinase
MLCYKNGALAREMLRDRYAGGNWLGFNELVEKTPPGCHGFLGFYFPLPEIIPSNVTGEFFFATKHIETSDDQPLRVDCIPDSMHPRAILESQLLSIRSRIQRVLPEGSPPPCRLILSGGGSTNEVIRQVAAVSRIPGLT